MADATKAFIERWTKSGGAERANYQLFLSELAGLIGAPGPEPARPSEAANNYVFDKTVHFKHADGSETVGFIDLYKRECFVCEAKQSVKEGKRATDASQIALFGDEDARSTKAGTAVVGTARWDLAMEKARRQAEGYAKALPKEHGWPPFLVIADVGHCIELFADFSGQGKNYTQFPDRRTFRIMLADLAREDVRERLHLVWTNPEALDPAKRSAEVTRDIAERLAIVARDMEKKEDPQVVALFLMRCLFTMFAEDAGLLPKRCFQDMLERHKGKVAKLQHSLTDLWRSMNAGGFSAGLEEEVRHFNGGLFADAKALPLTEDMLGHLIVSASRDWREVEPAIFGTLLERALSPKERAALGAHYTPRVYVERLVIPTIMEPLQDDWAAARVEAQRALNAGDKAGAIRAVRTFLVQLCNTRVLDPACGTGNFLYVAMELMKRLEGEVREFLQQLGGQNELGLGVGEANGQATTDTIDPHNFLGIELNPRAKEIAELVLWIGFLKWQIRTMGADSISEPVLRDFKTIEWRDALLTYDRQDLLRDAQGKPITKWDGQTMKLHPITGQEIPDESARFEVKSFVNPRIANWPEAEFIVGNPPFIGGKDIRAELGDGYAEALWASRSKRKYIPNAADFVMYWWDQAAHALTATGSKLRRFGFVTTNSITQTFSRRVIQHYLDQKQPLSLALAIPDHPWVKGEARANVRIAMTVAHRDGGFGLLREVTSEGGLETDTPRVEMKSALGRISADFTIGADVAASKPLQANGGLSSRGMSLHGSGFIVTPAGARGLGLGTRKGLDAHIRPYLNGRDFAQTSRGKMVIDMWGLSESEVRVRFPEVHQHLYQTVFEARRAVVEKSATRDAQEYLSRWWTFGKPRQDLRAALKGLPRYIATVETSKHRVFQFLDALTVPDNKLVCIAQDDAAFLAQLSSRIHTTWALAAGGWLGVGNDPVYVKTACFDAFPFPSITRATSKQLASLGEELDAFRKARLSEHRDLTVTDMYNVLGKLRGGTALEESEKLVNERGLISTLKRIHDQIDDAVAAAYGWPTDLPDAAILDNLVALNRARSKEERRGMVHWLRPAFQNPSGKSSQIVAAAELALETDDNDQRVSFPESVGERARAVRAALSAMAGPATADEVARTFRQGGRIKKSVSELLETMTALGQAQESGGRYFAV